MEGRNFEIRKDVLKYDEVLNTQRKIIYQRRQQILDGEDLGAEAHRIIAEVATRITTLYCEGDYPETWNIDSLLKDTATYFPTTLSHEKIARCNSVSELQELMTGDALDLYTKKESEIGDDRMRDIERRVMLDVIDQHWREHLYEMDYLREGINLRAMGQRDPLTEWQHDGFDMFEAMVDSIEDDFVQFVMKLEVIHDQQNARPTQNLTYFASDDPVQGLAGMTPGQDAALVANQQGMVNNGDIALPAPVHVEQTPGRNDPCFCGSGKKYKFCHGQ